MCPDSCSEIPTARPLDVMVLASVLPAGEAEDQEFKAILGNLESSLKTCYIKL